MKVLAINGSPRKKHNTGLLLEWALAGAASKGATTELIHLKDYRYTGCLSCFACKKIGGSSYGRCAVKDELTPILEKAHEAEALVIGSPIYLSTESAFARAFLERLGFQYILYSKIKGPLSPKKKGVALVYAMNISEDLLEPSGTGAVIKVTKSLMERLFAPCEVLLSCDTLQFDDYSAYDTDMWDSAAKRRRREEVFPLELEKAFAIGQRLAG
ncbi:MAG: flavodoxin family protein [Deltaproteobacteria bacterium]|jgi:multimeric flavodoxin WrbA|nr:flavodoxin family protein [Deltaproteobacteria bacterium]